MPLLSFLDENRGNILVKLCFIVCLANVFLFQFKVHRCSAFFVFKSETQEGPQFSLGFPDKEMQDGCLVHNIFDAKFLQVYFTLSQCY